MTETRNVSEGPASDDTTPPPSSVRFVCPQCHTPVTRRDGAWICGSADCRRRYPIIDGIPKFIVEDAEQLEPVDWEALVRHADSS
jgi:uncharacterized protein YbaR (Trm112 family)